MKSYEIMDPELRYITKSMSGIDFSENMARSVYHTMVDGRPPGDARHGLVLVLVEEETPAEADKARLDWLQDSKRCPWWDGALNCWGIGRDSGFKTMREAIDAARNAPPVKKTVIERPE